MKKQEKPINAGNKKIIIFTAFADTAQYLYEHVSKYAKEEFGLDTALITGSVEGKSTLKGSKMDMNRVLTYFSPVSKGKAMLNPPAGCPFAPRCDAAMKICLREMPPP